MGRLRRLAVLGGFALAGILVAALPPLLGVLAGTSAAIVAAAASLGAVLGVTIKLVRETHARAARIERRFGGRADQLDAVLHDVRDGVGELRSDISRAEARLRTSLDKTIRQQIRQTRHEADLHYRQVESLLNLHALIDVRAALPPSRRWAASPDLLLTYVGEILLRRPALVVECGSGLSTLWAAYALELTGGPGRVVALEHDPEFLDRTSALLDGHGLADWADLRLAPIRETKVGSETHPWYDPDKIADLYEVGVLMIDGPIGSLSPEARYPAVPLLRERFSPGAVILLDDANRAEEKAIVQRWTTEWPELGRLQLPHEKGAFALEVPR